MIFFWCSIMSWNSCTAEVTLLQRAIVSISSICMRRLRLSSCSFRDSRRAILYELSFMFSIIRSRMSLALVLVASWIRSLYLKSLKLFEIFSFSTLFFFSELTLMPCLLLPIKVGFFMRPGLSVMLEPPYFLDYYSWLRESFRDSWENPVRLFIGKKQIDWKKN